MKMIVYTASALLFAFPTLADIPQVLAATITQSGNGWRFDVTIQHADAGWEHYADGWGVYLEDGTELGYRELAHPHDSEMPFTRSLSGVEIPDGVARVFVRPRDLVHGEGESFAVELP